MPKQSSTKSSQKNSHTPPSDKAVKDLETELKHLTREMERYHSIPRNFGISMMRGFASALGATLVFGLGLALVVEIVRSIDYVPILNQILNSAAIEEVIGKFTIPQ